MNYICHRPWAMYALRRFDVQVVHSLVRHFDEIFEANDPKKSLLENSLLGSNSMERSFDCL